MSEVVLPNPATLKELLRKVVLVTGAASGIGLATARLFAQNGAKVILVDLDAKKLQDVAQSIGHECDSYACDVSSWEQQVALFNWATRIYGPPEIVCLNAGIDPELATSEQASAKERVASNYLADEENGQFLKPPPKVIFDVNFYGVLYGIKLAVHHLEDGRAGRIIITGSAASYIPVPYQDMYVASKHALMGLMRSTSRREELRAKNVSIAMVGPWLTRTGLTANLPPDAFQGHEASEPEDVALGIAYLATTENETDINGKCLWVRGKRCIEIEGAYEKWLAEMMGI
ncbi:uncharacterized protein Z520_05757 [Fonsecaea multimorphosa CBS 102226]|uniref:Uncharacterized protein n=1 Tax=Fonsecaea multimorphosa CBS 102226 TaxID=1442371 RepID=A0A0D2IN74_9EURO|nr:uncharacterized protein Z520_05757 [Fonsecaea multimorphosa CBS 102226]KIX98456.1 hypothetical protein Z520_05757 [Fonsecaea multimorphosa CBS 102226]OAL24652.1 hypothetical protein AYO22_05441 [Fonsecaea multimorphosa]